MKKMLFGALLCAATTAAHAQAPTDVPKHKCGAAPQMPTKTLMADKMVRRTFDQDLKTYKECMNAYLDERKAAIKVHEEAANAAINEFNAAMKSLIEAQQAMQGK